MENKKTKLTISGNPKKSFKDFSSSNNQTKKTVVIDKKSNKQLGRGSLNKTFSSRKSILLIRYFFRPFVLLKDVFIF